MKGFTAEKVASTIEEEKSELILEIGPGVLSVLSASGKIQERVSKGASFVAVDCGKDDYIQLEILKK